MTVDPERPQHQQPLRLSDPRQRRRAGWRRAEDVAEILSMWTGIPIYQFTEEESERLLRMEEEIGKRVVGGNFRF